MLLLFVYSYKRKYEFTGKAFHRRQIYLGFKVNYKRTRPQGRNEILFANVTAQLLVIGTDDKYRVVQVRIIVITYISYDKRANYG